MNLVVHLADFGWPIEADEMAGLLDDGGPDARELIEQLRWLARLGVDTVIGRVEGLEQRTPIELLARHVVPVVAELPARPEQSLHGRSGHV